ncbi:MAG: TetR/AcrR family transcriptional regulator [Acidimicrobiaceae bacterium]|nr:TetR/AcrR family transcriptional regulator [Acidimicrobiaceae bacterium]
MSEGTVTETAESPTPADEPNRRPPNRRALILEAAIQLFHERGYPATSVDDIGSAVDVSGPAIYRHFSSKEEILIEAVILAADEVHQAIQATQATEGNGESLLERYVSAYVRTAMRRSALIAVWTSEARHLSAQRRSPMSRRLRAWINDWTAVLVSVRPELTKDQAHLLVTATIGMITSVATTARVDWQTQDRLTTIAMATLHAPIEQTQ